MLTRRQTLPSMVAWKLSRRLYTRLRVRARTQGRAVVLLAPGTLCTSVSALKLFGRNWPAGGRLGSDTSSELDGLTGYGVL